MKRERCSNDDVVPSSRASSSDITDPSPSTKYDVFLNFRGEDTRDGFTSHLYEALCRENIKTFIDEQLEKGKEISPDLLETIEKSEIYVIIFSKNYASSTWCLDELVNILECEEKYGRIVIPIFYKVDPSNIRKQSGSFKNSFIKHEQRFNNNMDKVQRWKDALTQVANLSGWDSRTTRPESRLVKKIVKDVLRKLDHNPSYSLEGLVGIQHHVLQMEALLSLTSPEVVIVGLWGMGGIGKTTLAKLLYQKLKANFESCSFVENAREQLKRDGLNQLESRCLLELLDDGDIGTCDIRSSYAKNRLQRKRILLVLDDVDNYIRVENLIKLCDWFGRGSRIIITSRDKQVLKNATAYRTYHVKEMNFHDALQLFSLEAFKENEPTKIFVELSKQVVNYCQGIPLALKVWGNFLYDRRKEEWEDALEKLKQAPHVDIFNVFKISFDGLDDNQKNIFLDLVCFFGGRYNLFMQYMGDFHDFPINIEIRVLIERSLISIDDGVIIMHDLVRAMGREIAHQQFISEPKKSVRLWKHEDIYDVFKNNKEIEMIHGICLDMCSTKIIHLKANAFEKMHKLFPNLKRINLRGSKLLDKLPDLSQAPNLETIYLFGCKNLVQVHSSAILPKLQILGLDNCNVRRCVNLATGNNDGITLGLVAVYNCFDLDNFSLIKVTIKIFTSDIGKFSAGFKFKAECASFTEILASIDTIESVESKSFGQHLASLFPFVSKLRWLDLGILRCIFLHVLAMICQE